MFVCALFLNNVKIIIKNSTPLCGIFVTSARHKFHHYLAAQNSFIYMQSREYLSNIAFQVRDTFFPNEFTFSSITFLGNLLNPIIPLYPVLHKAKTVGLIPQYTLCIKWTKSSEFPQQQYE